MISSRNVRKDESGKRRPGRKGNFHGQRLELLESFLPDWDKARQNRTTGDFWSTVTSAYWNKFHWQLKHDEEPSGDIPTDENLTIPSLPLTTTISYTMDSLLSQLKGQGSPFASPSPTSNNVEKLLDTIHLLSQATLLVAQQLQEPTLPAKAKPIEVQRPHLPTPRPTPKPSHKSVIQSRNSREN